MQELVYQQHCKSTRSTAVNRWTHFCSLGVSWSLRANLTSIRQRFSQVMPSMIVPCCFWQHVTLRVFGTLLCQAQLSRSLAEEEKKHRPKRRGRSGVMNMALGALLNEHRIFREKKQHLFWVWISLDVPEDPKWLAKKIMSGSHSYWFQVQIQLWYKDHVQQFESDSRFKTLEISKPTTNDGPFGTCTSMVFELWCHFLGISSSTFPEIDTFTSPIFGKPRRLPRCRWLRSRC